MFGVAGIVYMWLRLKGKIAFSVKSLPKGRFFKFATGVLCLLIVSVMFSVPVSLVSADVSHRSLIFGDRDFGHPSSKPDEEVANQTELCGWLYDMFSGGGYTADNFQGSGTTYNNVLYQLSNSLGYLYDTVAVVYFDHGIGSNGTAPSSPTGDTEGNWHYSVYGNDGNPIFDKDIYSSTGGKTSKVNFAFISTCMSANKEDGRNVDDETGKLFYYGNMTHGINNYGYAVGMPFAWTNRIVTDMNPNFDVNTQISSDGYHSYSKDGGDQCYIGFPMGSPSLSQLVDSARSNRNYGWWVLQFLLLCFV
jgi:hypothetical protein